ncbi:7-cyano-7-deazaguanine/7-aminomethyl-7-deazaguanine transporter [Tepidicella baoligensis]|uniref:7-cyano-7-deazaguanine/7-aminomethyl-7- deazaguanine transporter n=1 Tax=Tepidicella baoligensis TaxID=2707016 RepID=UPI0015D9ECBC|nr:7-cyano-7-deazaguanine/7-aminomethyl-7-deazaguanine transporter [Tepidicella baoligensis]
MTSPHGAAELRARSVLPALAAIHIALIIASNYLVQLPFELFGFHTTWGAFTFPLIFVATDLTVRLLGQEVARRVIMRVMIPALLASYAVGVLFHDGAFGGVAALGEFNGFVFRIALASFVAYVMGQWLDIAVFARLQQVRAWWVAPAASTVLGSLLDTALFFSVAFYHSSDPFMAEHWVEIAAVDYVTKLVISLLCFLPLYAVLLNALVKTLKAPTPTATAT